MAFFPLWVPIAFAGVFETVAFSIGLDDVNPVGQSVQQRSGESFAAHHFSPLLKGQIRGHDQTLVGIQDAIPRLLITDFLSELGLLL